MNQLRIHFCHHLSTTINVPSSNEFFSDDDTISNAADDTVAKGISIGKRYNPILGYVINIDYTHE
jgi:hypothetical protein